MKDFVSGRTLCVAAIVAMTATWGVLVGPLGSPSAGVWSLSLIALSVMTSALWVGLGSAPSLAQVTSDAEAGPQLAPVRARRTWAR